jgi:hypothetical protein
MWKESKKPPNGKCKILSKYNFRELIMKTIDYGRELIKNKYSPKIKVRASMIINL